MRRDHTAGIVLIALAMAMVVTGCGANVTAPAPVPSPGVIVGSWGEPAAFADGGEVPLSYCGRGDPPCRRPDPRHAPVLAMNARGQAVALWHRNEGGYRLFASRFEPSAGWSGPQAVSPPGSDEHRTAIDAAGNAVGLWQWEVPPYDEVTRTDRHGIGTSASSGQAWTSPQRIGDQLDRAHELVLDAEGHGFALSSRLCGPSYSPSCGPGVDLQATRFQASSGWETPRTIRQQRDPCHRMSLLDGQVAAGPRGTGLSVWVEYGTTSVGGCTENFHELWTAAYRPSEGWAEPSRLDRADGVTAGFAHPDLAVDSSGDAVLVFERRPQYGVHDVWMRRFTPESGWLPAEIVAPGGFNPRMAADGEGNVFLTWRTQDAAGIVTVWGRWRSKALGWEEPRVLPAAVASYAESRVALGAGHAMFAWFASDARGDGTGSILAARYVPRRGWEPPQPLQRPHDLPAIHGPGLAMDAEGNALAVWAEFDGVRVRLAYNRFTVERRD